MNTRMEKVAGDIALTVLRKAASAAQPPIHPEELQQAFQERWPVPDSLRPMNDAMRAAAQAASNCTEQSQDSWESNISRVWPAAVEQTVQEYFKAARKSFRGSEPLDGVETLTDAVRATLGHIAAARNWPHSVQDDLYRTAVALASMSNWPNTAEEFDHALNNTSREGKNLLSALGASMGRPDMLSFGVYVENPDGPEEDGFLFAQTTIELANRQAGQQAALL